MSIPAGYLHYLRDGVCEWLQSLLPRGFAFNGSSSASMAEFGLKLDMVSVFAHERESWRFSEWNRLPGNERTLEKVLEITAGEESGDGYCVLLRGERRENGGEDDDDDDDDDDDGESGEEEEEEGEREYEGRTNSDDLSPDEEENRRISDSSPYNDKDYDDDKDYPKDFTNKDYPKDFDIDNDRKDYPKDYHDKDNDNNDHPNHPPTSTPCCCRRVQRLRAVFAPTPFLALFFTPSSLGLVARGIPTDFVDALLHQLKRPSSLF